MALELERRARSADRRVRQVAFADYGDMAAEAGRRQLDRASPPRPGAPCRAWRWRPSPAPTPTARPASGSPPPGARGISTSTRPSPTRSSAPPACSAPPRRARGAAWWSSTPVSPPRCWPSCPRRCRARRSPRAGRSLPTGWARRWRWRHWCSWTTPPTPGPSGRRPTTPKAWPAGATSSSSDGVLRGFVFDTTAGTARRGGVDGVGGAGWLRHDPRRRVPGAAAVAGDARGGRDPRRRGRGPVRAVDHGVHSGVNPVSGDFSVGAEGLMVRGGVLAEPVREVTIASTLQRMLQSVLHIGVGRGVAPGRGRRSDRGHRRDGAERLVGAVPSAGRAARSRSGSAGGDPDWCVELPTSADELELTRSPDFPDEFEDAAPPSPTRRTSLASDFSDLSEDSDLSALSDLLGLLRRRPTVGLVEAAALEDHADGPEDLAQRPSARRALGQGVVAELLHDVVVLAAGLALVLVGRHARPGFPSDVVQRPLWHSPPSSAKSTAGPDVVAHPAPVRTRKVLVT